MKPDAYMPFYGLDFFQAVEGYPDHIALGYLRAVWHYWTHTHCSGLRNDSEFLRKLTRIEKEVWEEAFEIIFDNDQFFTMDAEGLWHQKRACEEWQKAEENYMRRVRQTANAAKARRSH